MKILTAASLSPTGERLKAIFLRLLEHFGPRFWWPAETPFEVCLGAILTQNTAWTNVEKAISALKGANVLTVEGIEATPAGRLAELIRPSGYYNVKSVRIKGFVEWLRERLGKHSGVWKQWRRQPDVPELGQQRRKDYQLRDTTERQRPGEPDMDFVFPTEGDARR